MYKIKSHPPKTAFIWLPEVTHKAKCISTVSHELLHATGFILDWAGVKHTYENDEAYTYLLGHLTEQFWNKLKINDRRTENS